MLTQSSVTVNPIAVATFVLSNNNKNINYESNNIESNYSKRKM